MIKLRWLFILSMILSISGCDKSEDIELNTIDGIYNGSIQEVSVTNLDSKVSYNNIVGEITRIGDQLEFHCYGQEIDVTIMLEYFEHHEKVMVCLTGNDYSELYGHPHGAGMMSGMGMNQMNSGSTDWERHLNGSHNQEDHHFLSGFNMNDRTFNCTFNWNGATVTFTGIKR